MSDLAPVFALVFGLLGGAWFSWRLLSMRPLPGWKWRSKSCCTKSGTTTAFSGITSTVSSANVTLLNVTRGTHRDKGDTSGSREPRKPIPPEDDVSTGLTETTMFNAALIGYNETSTGNSEFLSEG